MPTHAAKPPATPMPVSVLIAGAIALSPACEAAWLERLPPARRSRVAAHPDPRERQRSLLASRLLAEALARLGQRAAFASLHDAGNGRPALDAPLGVSVSHGDGRVVCAVSTEGPVGVDIEAVGVLRADAFRRYLNDAERAWAGRSARRFYAVWTRKEAVVKAAGSRGLQALPEVDTSVGPAEAAFAGRVWATPRLAVGRGHVAHLALPLPMPRVVLTRVAAARLVHWPD